MDFYAEEIMEHYRSPHNAGKVKKPTAKFAMNNTLCGDKINVTLQIENGILKDFKFESNGCAISIASASMLSDAIIGKKVDEILNMDANSVFEILKMKVGFNRIKCMMLPLNAVQEAIKNCEG
jgi:nitrogen fixation protein NifU and related proteins